MDDQDVTKLQKQLDDFRALAEGYGRQTRHLDKTPMTPAEILDQVCHELKSVERRLFYSLGYDYADT